MSKEIELILGLLILSCIFGGIAFVFYRFFYLPIKRTMLKDKSVQKVINEAAKEVKVQYKEELDKINKFTGENNKND